jgi:hypothetical protein
LIQYQGVNSFSLPLLEDVNKIIDNLTIETFQHDPLTSHDEFDKEAISILDEGKIVIGYYCK